MILKFSILFFLLVLFVVFHLSPSFLRKYVLLLGSIIFIHMEGGNFGLIILLLITVFTYMVGMFFLKETNSDNVRKAAAFIGIALVTAILFGWKYIPWIMQQMGMDTSFLQEGFGAPIGLSFYAFQSISYIADLCKGSLKPEKNPINMALYMMWFPKWMSGPIERAGGFMAQINRLGEIRLFDGNRMFEAIVHLVIGLFMKVVIADRLGIVVDTVFEDISVNGAFTLMLTSVLYTIQIYCDFAGYTNMMIGVSKLFGINLMQNFKTPYMAKNISDFWRRWHISLSGFLRDYVYIPLGGNRKGEGRRMINVLMVFFICGMWHGAGLSFIIWGLIHGILSCITAKLSNTRAEFLVEGVFGHIITFCMVSFAWIFFRAPSITQAILFIKNMIPGVNVNSLIAGLQPVESLILGIMPVDWCIVVISILLLFALDVFAYKKDYSQYEAICCLGDIQSGLLIAVAVVVIMIFGIYGAGEDIRSFVYMNF